MTKDRVKATLTRWNLKERARLEKLDAIVRSDELRAEIGPIVDRVCTALSQKLEALMTWEPIPLEIFGEGLPPKFDQVGFSFCVPALIPARNDIPIVTNA
jgi:hypothetical protein